MNVGTQARCIYENYIVLRYHAACSGNSLPKFRDDQPVPSSLIKNLYFPLKMGPTRCPETSARNYHYTVRGSPEERSSHLLRGGCITCIWLSPTTGWSSSYFNLYPVFPTEVFCYTGCLKTYVTNFPGYSPPPLRQKVPINMGPKVNRFRDIDLRSCTGIEYYIRCSKCWPFAATRPLRRRIMGSLTRSTPTVVAANWHNTHAIYQVTFV
jgi:hypothetical protein